VAETIAAPTVEITRLPRPYAPGWFDRFTDWVDSLKMPSWFFYLALAVILGGVQLLIQWDGKSPVYPFPLLYIVTIPYNLALSHYLDRVAAQALERFRPLLKVSTAEYYDLLYRLTTLPSRPTLVATFIGALYGIWTLDWVPHESKFLDLHFANTPLSVNLNHGLALPLWAVIGVLAYHTLHQLRIVQQIYNHCSGIDLFALRPLYAFSTLSARTAVGITFISYLWNLVAPSLSISSSSVFHLILLTALALVTFILPLWGAHRVLGDEKDRLLNENGERLRLAVAELHHRVDVGEMVDMDNLNKTLASLELEHATLERISTWPWKPETAQVVAAALLFPVIVWLMQWVLQKMLGG
jgi:hypothetical protein